MYTKEQILAKQKVDTVMNDLMEMEKIFFPHVLFIIEKENALIVGVRDECACENEYVMVDINDKVIVVNKLEGIEEVDEDGEVYVDEPRIEKALLQKLNDGWKIVSFDLNFHFDVWDFFDEFIYDLSEYEDGMHEYLGYCIEHGITEKFISGNSMIMTADYFSSYPPCDVFNDVKYSHIMKQQIGDEQLCLSYLGSLSTTEDFRVVFTAGDMLTDIQSFKTISEAADLYMEIYKAMTMDGEKYANNVIGYMKKFLERVNDGRELQASDPQSA